MNKVVRVIFIPKALRALRSLKKRYRHADEDVETLLIQLRRGETPGDRVQGVDPSIVYKARLPNRDAARGKSGGYRVVYYSRTAETLFVLGIYSKSDQSDLEVALVRQLIAELEDALKAFAASDTDDNPPPSA
ncbi:MAG: type II toxin-antitoxin system RelE/ParE family toxin [Chloroflexota bacterium]|nr:type II toxin-antitoxin system RelE/ParE family toxin [Chloroflexota bacterium]